MSDAVLFILAGLPGSGKSTIGRLLATEKKATWLRADTIEQGLRDLCEIEVEGEGYRLAYRIAADNLKAGNSVVADSCNPLELTRTEWRGVAENLGATAVDIEIFCSDEVEHRARVEGRKVDVPGLVLPDWQAVLDREYHPWQTDRIRIDTAGRDPATCLKELLDQLPS